MTHSHVGLAVVGCGNFARRQHLPNLASIPEALLVAVCDVDPQAAAAAAVQFGAVYATDRLDKVLEDAGVRAVIVAVRDHLQAEVTAAALLAGKDVYVEKPAAETEEDFARLIELRDRVGRRVAVGFNKRFAPIYLRARAWIDDAGGLHSAFVRMADDAWRWAHGYPPGSLLRHDVCHLFDLLRWLTRDEVDAVVAMSGRPDDDQVILRFRRGAVATVMSSGHATMDFPKERLEVVTERGVVTADDFVELRRYGVAVEPCEERFRGVGDGTAQGELSAELFAARGLEGMRSVRRAIWMARQGAPDPPPEGALAATLPNFLRDQGWRAALTAFVHAIREGPDHPLPHASLEDARAAARIASAAIRSRDRGATVLSLEPASGSGA